MFKKTQRFIRITYYTFVMYVVTHALVLVLSLVWLTRSVLSLKSGTSLKVLFGKSLFKILNKKVTISGLENIEPGKHHLVVANYPSGYAGFVMMMLFPAASILVHSFMSKVPVLSNLLERNGFIYAHNRGYKATRNAVREMIRKGKPGLIILPEGKPTNDGRIHEFKRGFIHIVRNTSLDLLPITLNGFYKLKPFFKRVYIDPDADLEVIIHKPITQTTITKMSDKQILKETVDLVTHDYKL